MISLIISGFLIGIAGAGHCLGMCGGLASLLTLGKAPSFTTLLFYNLGRIVSYFLLTSAFAISFHYAFGDTYSALLVPLRTVSGIILILMGLYVCGLSKWILKLEQAGRILWRFIQPLSKRLLPVSSYKQALAAGFIWGWLPCGLVYSTVLWSLTQASPTLTMAAMVGFAAGTLPSMLLVGAFATQFKQIWEEYRLRWVFGVMICLYGVYSLPIIKTTISNW